MIKLMVLRERIFFPTSHPLFFLVESVHFLLPSLRFPIEVSAILQELLRKKREIVHGEVQIGLLALFQVVGTRKEWKSNQRE